MDRAAYQKMAENEETHWWFAGRRAYLASLIKREFAGRAGALSILEAGCGSGGNLELLSRFGTVDAFELDENARALAAARGIAEVTPGQLPDKIRQADGKYDLVALFDVLEHVEEHRETLEALARKLNADGRILVTVPAMPWLWSEHDVRHHHKRRYTATTLREVIGEAGLEVVDLGHFNALLFPLALADRVVTKLTGKGRPGEEKPAELLNQFLYSVFALERHMVGARLHAPVGLSLYAVMRRP